MDCSSSSSSPHVLLNEACPAEHNLLLDLLVLDLLLLAAVLEQKMLVLVKIKRQGSLEINLGRIIPLEIAILILAVAAAGASAMDLRSLPDLKAALLPVTARKESLLYNLQKELDQHDLVLLHILLLAAVAVP